MKQFIGILLLTYFSIPGFGQNISMEQLIGMQKMTTKDIIQYLTSHGWELTSSKNDLISRNEYFYKFAYNKNRENDAATAFFIIRSDNIVKERTLQLRLFNATTYNSYKCQLEYIGFKKESGTLSDFAFSSAFISDPEYLEHDSNLCDIYRRKNVSVQLCTQSQAARKNTTTVYVIRIRKS